MLLKCPTNVINVGERESTESTSRESFTISNEVHVQLTLMITVVSYFDTKPLSLAEHKKKTPYTRSLSSISLRPLF